MTSTFPNSLDNFPTNRTNDTAMYDTHPQDHDNLADAINKIETVIGVEGAISTVRYFFNVKDLAFGAKGDNSTDDAASIQAALNAAAAAPSNFTGNMGGIVYMPPGAYRVSTKLLIPKGVLLLGAGPQATIIVPTNTFSQTAIIANQYQDGNQEFAFLQGFTVSANKGGGAVCSVAAVDFVGLFVNSFIRDICIENSSTVGLHVGGALVGSGPVLVENIWVHDCDHENVVIDETSGNTNSVETMTFNNLTSEHQGVGYAAVRVTGYGHISGVRFRDLHIEANGGTGTSIVKIDGCSDVTIDGFDMYCVPITSTTGIQITNSAFNIRFSVSNLRNINTVSLVLDDQKNGVQFNNGENIGFYSTNDGTFADMNIMPFRGHAVLTYGPTISGLDCTRGSYFEIVVSNTTAFSISNPTNAQVGQIIYLEIANGSGGAMGTITWPSNFIYRDTSWTNPVNGKRRLISFIHRGGGYWIQNGPATGDM